MLLPEPQLRKTAKLARAGFTLMEMMAVVAILVVLVGIAVPIYMRYVDSANLKRARADIETLDKAVEAYWTEHNYEWPPDLDTLARSLGDGNRPYIKEGALYDPWQRKYQSTLPNMGGKNGDLKRPDIWTVTPDGSKEIGNWQDVRVVK